MKYLAPKLKHRIQILQGYQSPDRLGFRQQYRMLVRLWAGVKEVNIKGNLGVQPVRAENIGVADTHKFTVRYNSVISRTDKTYSGGDWEHAFPASTTKGLGKAFTIGYSTGFDSITDLNPIKVDYFVFFESGLYYRGRLFKINRLIRDDNYKEYIEMMCTEVQEKGTGAKP